MSSAHGRNNPAREVLRRGITRVAPPRRRKTLRQHFCDGIEAAVKAEPEVFAATKPRTMMGQMVQELVRIAATGRCAQIRLVASYLDEAEARRNEAQAEGVDDSQGNSAPEEPPEPEWDWDEDGNWDASGREPGGEAAKLTEAEEHQAVVESMRAKLDAAIQAIEERRDAERGDGNALPGTRPVPISGKIPATATAEHAAGTMRVGGRLVDG